MDRVCGATAERDNLSARACWCRGFFCGKGGYKQSVAFRHQFRKKVTARNWAEFEHLVCQMDLFDGPSVADAWITRLRDYTGRHAPHGSPKPSPRPSASA